MRFLWPVLAGLLVATPAFAQMAGETPPELQGNEIVDRSGEFVPQDIRLLDEAGNKVKLEDYLGGHRPVLIQLVYYNCPMLCSMVLNGYVKAAKGVNWTPGDEYTVLSVSFDPRDTPEVAAAKKTNYVNSLGRLDANEGWHFLTGEAEQVQALAEALGFGYRWDTEKQEFAHAAGMFVLTPEGRISRTLWGIEFSPNDLRLSLLEAAQGNLGSPLDRLILYCFRYDSETHKYALVARNVMKLGAVLTLVGLGGFLLVQWTRERRRRRIPHPA